jgi:hypothetical protein
MLKTNEIKEIYRLSNLQEQERLSMFDLLKNKNSNITDLIDITLKVLDDENTTLNIDLFNIPQEYMKKFDTPKKLNEYKNTVILESFYKYIENYFQILTNDQNPIKYLQKNKDLYNRYKDLLLKDENFQKDFKMALIERYVILKDNTLITVLENYNISKDKEEIELFQRICYLYVSDVYTKQFDELLNQFFNGNIKDISKEVKIILINWVKIGKVMNQLQVSWENHIIYNVNKEFDQKFNSVSDGIKFLIKNNLIENGHNDEIADRTYSVIVKEKDIYKNISYYEAFTTEIDQIIQLLQNTVDELKSCKNYSFEKKSWEGYLLSLIDAFSETSVNNLIEKWSKVDERWMKLKGPLQPGHFFEYYEDKYRKAVAIEWDMRIDDLTIEENHREETITTLFNNVYNTLLSQRIKGKEKYQQTYDEVLNNLKTVQVHIGKPLLYFGSSFNGLASAQVIPNDEEVSKKYGKKIFAFHEKGLEIAKNKPFLKMSKEIFGNEIIKLGRKNIFKHPERDLKVYDILTIGHEYGHILFKASDTEILMNQSGEFKNIEEYKATSGGIVAFFDSKEEDEYWKEVFADIIKRSVSLIAWKEVNEVEPYYVESLIILTQLFRARVLEFKPQEINDNEKLHINFNKKYYESFKRLMKLEYQILASHYLDKKDASLFLKDYVVRKDDGFYNSIDLNISNFVEWYYKYQKENSTIIDETSSKEDYL